MKELEELTNYYYHYYVEELGLSNFKQRLKKRIARIRGKYFYNFISQYLKIENKKILDIGCGCGEFLYQCQHKNNKLYGIEPDERAVEISKLILPQAQILKAHGEKLPFKENSFDLIINFHVLEHVNDLRKTVSEMMRVLKNEGFIFIECPNYLYPVESHYKIFWFPFLPKFIGKIYLRILKRPTDFIEGINYVNPYLLENIFRSLGIKFVDLARKNYTDNLKKKKRLKKFLGYLVLYLKLYRPLDYYLRKF